MTADKSIIAYKNYQMIINHIKNLGYNKQISKIRSFLLYLSSALIFFVGWTNLLLQSNR
jgi:hypothetical protein